jgi:hypothetical protein
MKRSICSSTIEGTKMKRSICSSTIEGTKRSEVFVPRLSKEGRRSEVFVPQLSKERRRIEVFVPQLSKERRRSEVFVPQLSMICHCYLIRFTKMKNNQRFCTHRPLASLTIYRQCVSGGGELCCRPYFARILHSISDQIPNLPNCFTTPNKMTSEVDIKR